MNKQRIPSLENFVSESIVTEGGKWQTKNLTSELYNFWASLDVASNNLSSYMDDMNKGKEPDALWSLKIAHDELIDIKKILDINIKAIAQELKEKNQIR